MFAPRPLPRNLAAALRDVRSTKVAIRLSAVRDLVRHTTGPGRASAIAALEEALRGDPSAAVRAEAALALADGEASESVAVLIEAQDDVERRVRQLALLALGELAAPGNGHVSGVVHAALRDEGPELRYQALIAAQRLLPEFAPDALLSAMNDPDPAVRHLAFRLAEERWLDAGSGEVPDLVLEAARRALGDPEASVKLIAAIVLGRVGDVSGGAILVSAIGGRLGELDVGDEQAAIELSGELGLAEAQRALTRRAFGGLMGRGDRLAWQSRIALARLGDPRAREAILAGLSAWTRDARTLAVAAAGRAGIQEARPAIVAMQGDPRRAEPSAVSEALDNLARAGMTAASPADAAGVVTGPGLG